MSIRKILLFLRFLIDVRHIISHLSTQDIKQFHPASTLRESYNGDIIKMILYKFIYNADKRSFLCQLKVIQLGICHYIYTLVVKRLKKKRTLGYSKPNHSFFCTFENEAEDRNHNKVQYQKKLGDNYIYLCQYQTCLKYWLSCLFGT